MKLSLLLLYLLIVLFFNTTSINLIQLNTSISSPIIFQNGSITSEFISSSSQYSCSLSTLYTYSQSHNNLLQNTPYQIILAGITSITNISINTRYNVLSPNISAHQCNTDCTLTIQNNCPNPVGYFSYFDIIIINIQGLNQQIQYNVLCDQSFKDTFEAGLFLILIISIAIIILNSIFSRAWAFQTKGIQISYLYIAIYNSCMMVAVILLVFASNFISVIGDIVAWILGTLGILICCNQLIFKLHISQLSTALIIIKNIQIRITDIITFFIGTGFMFAWIFSNRNWIISDIIAICIIVSSIKVLKITSLKKALVLFFAMEMIEVIYIILIYSLGKGTFEDYFINNFNNPLQFQLPTINPSYGIKCSWLPLQVIIFPGLLISYFRRFDVSRNTHIYFITSSVLFFVGSIFWLIISVITPFNLPFQLLAEPAMIVLVCLFGYNRKQIKTLWNGKFYDAQFRNQEEQNHQDIELESSKQKSQFKQQFLDGLVLDHKQDSQIQPAGDSQYSK